MTEHELTRSRGAGELVTGVAMQLDRSIGKYTLTDSFVGRDQTIHHKKVKSMNDVSVKWPHKTPILIDPAKKKGIVFCLAAVAVVTVFVLKSEDVIKHFVTAHNRDVLRPQMTQLAAQGKPEAVAWMVMNDSAFRSDTHFEALKAAAETGDPQSMFIYGQVLKYQKNEQGAHDYIVRAAAEGYPDAVLAQSKDALR